MTVIINESAPQVAMKVIHSRPEVPASVLARSVGLLGSPVAPHRLHCSCCSRIALSVGLQGSSVAPHRLHWLLQLNRSVSGTSGIISGTAPAALQLLQPNRSVSGTSGIISGTAPTTLQLLQPNTVTSSTQVRKHGKHRCSDRGTTGGGAEARQRGLLRAAPTTLAKCSI